MQTNSHVLTFPQKNRIPIAAPPDRQEENLKAGFVAGDSLRIFGIDHGDILIYDETACRPSAGSVFVIEDYRGERMVGMLTAQSSDQFTIINSNGNRPIHRKDFEILGQVIGFQRSITGGYSGN